MDVFEKYNELRKKSPLAIVFMKVGDFYETYDVDAQTCHDILGLSLTKRTGTMHLLTGFPKHALEGYVKKLHDAGRATVVCNDDFSNSTTINNNQNSTTTMEKQFKTIATSVRNMFDEETQALVTVRRVREVINLNNGESRQYWRLANTNKEVMTRYTPATETEPEMFDGKIYDSQDAFEQGRLLSIGEVFYNADDEKDICRGLLQSRGDGCDVKMDEKGAYIWTFLNGEARKWYFREHIDTVEFDYHGECLKVTSDCECEIPESYSSCEDVYKYNDYRTIDVDGKETVHEGTLKRLFLEPDQQKMAEKLQAVIDECRDAGMCIYWSNCDYTLNAVNVRKIQRIEYDPFVDEETEEAIYFDDSRASHTFKNVDDWNSEDSCIRFVIKKA